MSNITLENLRWLGYFLASHADSEGIGQGSEGARYCFAAAEEIEQLRAQVSAQHAEIERHVGYCKTVDQLRSTSQQACNKAWIEIEELKRQLELTVEALEVTLKALRLPCDRWNKHQFLIVKHSIETTEDTLSEIKGKPCPK